MNLCNHIGWFNLSGRDGLHIHHDHRATSIIQQMTDPATQHPSMIFFLGRKCKDTALREIFPHNNIRRGRYDGLVNLRLDSSTISADVPLIIADADPFACIPSRIGAVSCHRTNALPLNWRLPPPKNPIYTLYARLVALFTDVVCIFADDFGGLDSVTSFLKQWIEHGNPSDLPLSLRPRVIVVLREDSVAATYDVLAMENFRHELHGFQDSRFDAFSSISLIHLPGDNISSLARHRRLKEFLQSEAESLRFQRIENRVHFTALHFEAFARQAIDHIANSITEPFGFIEKSRMVNTIYDDYTTHLTAFLCIGKDFFLPFQDQISFIASTIAMDAYPPRMHSKLYNNLRRE